MKKDTEQNLPQAKRVKNKIITSEASLTKDILENSTTPRKNGLHSRGYSDGFMDEKTIESIIE